jgi:protease I
MAQKKIKLVTLVHELFEDLELWYPLIRLREEEYELLLAGEEAGKTYTGKHGLKAKADISFSQLKPDNFDGVLVPGGYAPDKLRGYRSVTDFLKKMNEQSKAIGQICHAGQVLISADILKNRKVTSTPAIKDDIVNAGAQWTDEPVVTDGNLVSSRNPNDLHVYVPAFIDVLKNQ